MQHHQEDGPQNVSTVKTTAIEGKSYRDCNGVIDCVERYRSLSWRYRIPNEELHCLYRSPNIVIEED